MNKRKKQSNISFKLMFLFLLIFSINVASIIAQEDIEYQLPPQEIVDLVDAPLTPSIRIDPKVKWMLLLERPSLPPIEKLTKPELKLAGLRINPKINAESTTYYYTNIKLFSIDSKFENQITGLPSNPRIENVNWSPDGEKIAFTITKKNGIELWIAYVKNCKAKKITDAILNDTYYGGPYTWLSDSNTLIYKSIVENRGEPPEESSVPSGPVIQESIGKKAPVRTYQDLLKNSYDEDLFEYYITSQLMSIDLEGKSKKLGPQCMMKRFTPSPDNKYLFIEITKRPFSYIVTAYRFPISIEVWDIDGNLVKTLADIPLAEDIPKGFGAVRKGPRYFIWRSDAPSTIYWVVAQDEGDPHKEVEIRDKLFSLKAPFTQNPKEVLSFSLRYGGITWGDGNLAITHEFWRKDRREIISFFNPDSETPMKNVLFDRNWEDRYNDPGDFVTIYNQYGKYILLMEDNGKTLYLKGDGASPEGNRPFLDKFDLDSKNANRLWISEPPYYERFIRFVDLKNNVLLISRESQNIPRNYFLLDLKSMKYTQITNFPHPHPQLSNIKKELIKYNRKDGVQLTANLYLPPNYKKEDGTLPVLVWAYPQEYKSADAAGQVRDSPYRFIRIYSWSPLLWLTQGYAIFDNPSMPIIGEGDSKPNDTYIEQLVLDAEAAVDKLVSMEVADSNKIAIGGHSYGAFMTANLLAHTDLFAAGVAKTGAYNRTLTPFGFQSEDRLLWEAPETYIKMSPFMHADKINEPILLIHGESDRNSGTYPMQSERFYQALKGNGATARLVMLPYEGHSYRARESIMHVLWEMDRWLNKYVKNKNND